MTNSSFAPKSPKAVRKNALRWAKALVKEAKQANRRASRRGEKVRNVGDRARIALARLYRAGLK